MSKDVEALIRGAALPERSVEICMHPDLVAEHERLERELDKAKRQPRDSLAAGGAERQLAEQIQKLEADMEEATVEFKLRAMPRPTWKEFVAAHPPRKDGDKVDERDAYIGVNTETFFPAIVRRSVIRPELDDELWTLLLDEKLTDRQFDMLSNAAWALNRGEVDVPFSRAASRTLETSESE
ncbi:MAG TPA: hypothetical protein VIP77_16175 [Jiangellaceae bacterium]